MNTQAEPSKPNVTAGDTVDEIVRVSRRKQTFPVRTGFLQREENGSKVAGPAANLVKAGDRRGLQLYLLLLTKASADPWNAALPAAVWARALGLTLPESKTARSTVSKIWLRLERLGLVERGRKARLADVFLLREDGSRTEYTDLGGRDDRYFKVPLELWLNGPSPDERWYQVLTLPELVIILIGRSLGDAFRLPAESGPEWYGVSADTISRGLSALADRNLLDIDKTYKKAPLSPAGYTAEHRYTLKAPFGPVGRLSGKRVPRKRVPQKASPKGKAAVRKNGVKRKSRKTAPG